MTIEGMLDTRAKIVPPAEAPDRFAGRVVVAGYFDPLIDTHVERLRELAATRGPLAICICDPPDALLPANARAELAAACRYVEAVAVGEHLLKNAAEVIDEREGDLMRREALMRHVRERQKAAQNA